MTELVELRKGLEMRPELMALLMQRETKGHAMTARLRHKARFSDLEASRSIRSIGCRRYCKSPHAPP